MAGVCEKVAIQWCQYLRDVCSKWLLDHPYKIGGPGLSVEIDESVISKRKYHRGRMVPERWIFDGYCCTSGRGFLELVPDRSAETLLPLVQKYIHPGSLILSDQWAAYNRISEIDVHPPYEHQTVNHSVHFVDPVTGACTNNIEIFGKIVK